jgi:hypothetical protein
VNQFKADSPPATIAVITRGQQAEEGLQLGIVDLQLGLSTLEEVFLRVVAQQPGPGSVAESAA